MSRSPFYVAFAGACCLMVLTGFGRSFFFAPLFDAEPLAPIVVAHGVVLTAWFTLFIVQTLLVASRRTDLHRRLGAVGVVIALAGCAILVPTAAGVFARRPELASEVAIAVQTSQIVRDLMLFAPFAVFVALAVAFRGRPEAHKRLMLLASVALLPAALTRAFQLTPLGEAAAFFGSIGVLYAFVAAPAVHDYVTRKRVHPALAWAGPFYCLWIVVTIVVAEVMAGQ